MSFLYPLSVFTTPLFVAEKNTMNTERKKAVRFRAFESAAAAVASPLCVCYLRAAAAADEFSYRLRAKMAAGR